MIHAKSDSPKKFTIRPALTNDLPVIGALWLKGSLQAHHFVPADYWQEQLQTMLNDYLPNCELWLLEVDHEILGFSALHDSELSALFIRADKQG
jgi:putative acetyltransferase